MTFKETKYPENSAADRIDIYINEIYSAPWNRISLCETWMGVQYKYGHPLKEF